jgi:hypothetical protein
MIEGKLQHQQHKAQHVAGCKAQHVTEMPITEQHSI